MSARNASSRHRTDANVGATAHPFGRVVVVVAGSWAAVEVVTMIVVLVELGGGGVVAVVVVVPSDDVVLVLVDVEVVDDVVVVGGKPFETLNTVPQPPRQVGVPPPLMVVPYRYSSGPWTSGPRGEYPVPTIPNEVTVAKSPFGATTKTVPRRFAPPLVVVP